MLVGKDQLRAAEYMKTARRRGGGRNRDDGVKKSSNSLKNISLFTARKYHHVELCPVFFFNVIRYPFLLSCHCRIMTKELTRNESPGYPNSSKYATALVWNPLTRRTCTRIFWYLDTRESDNGSIHFVPNTIIFHLNNKRGYQNWTPEKIQSVELPTATEETDIHCSTVLLQAS